MLWNKHSLSSSSAHWIWFSVSHGHHLLWMRIPIPASLFGSSILGILSERCIFCIINLLAVISHCSSSVSVFQTMRLSRRPCSGLSRFSAVHASSHFASCSFACQDTLFVMLYSVFVDAYHAYHVLRSLLFQYRYDTIKIWLRLQQSMLWLGYLKPPIIIWHSARYYTGGT
jgi:hypothetical protein